MTAFTQTISQDSLKCFTYEQVRQITKDLKKGQLCDSITQNQQLQIINFKEVLRNDKDHILLITNRNESINKELKKSNLKLKISKRLSTFGIPVYFGAGFLVGFLLIN